MALRRIALLAAVLASATAMRFARPDGLQAKMATREEEDAEKAAMIADACFTAASAALDDLRGDLKQPRSAFALFKHDHTKDAVAATMDGHALNDDPAPGWYRELVPRRSGDKVDAYYYPPDGTQLRSRPDVRRYFEAIRPTPVEDAEKE